MAVVLPTTPESDYNRMADDLNKLSSDISDATGAELSNWFTLVTVVWLLTYIVPEWVHRKISVLLGTLAFFLFIPAVIIITAIEMATQKTIIMYGLGGFEIAALSAIWLIMAARSGLLFKRTSSWKSFRFGVMGILQVKIGGTHHFVTGTVNKNGIVAGVCTPRNGKMQIATSDGLWYLDCTSIKDSPKHMAYHTPMKSVLLERVDQVIQDGKSDQSGIIYYKAIKKMDSSTLAEMYGSSEDTFSLLLD